MPSLPILALGNTRALRRILEAAEHRKKHIFESKFGLAVVQLLAPPTSAFPFKDFLFLEQKPLLCVHAKL